MGEAAIHEETIIEREYKYAPPGIPYREGTLLAYYQNALDDPNLLSMRDEIALVDARIKKLVEVADEDVSARTWTKFIGLWQEFIIAIKSQDVKKQNEMLGRLNDFMDRVDRDINNWADINESISIRNKIVDAERRYLDGTKNMFTLEQVLQLLGGTILVMKEVAFRHADPDTARAIVTDASAYHRKLIAQREVAAE